jgi:ketosteroid isomerase-like protein
MKHLVFFLFVFILTNTVSFAQSADELEIRRLETLWTQLLDKADTTALLKIWSKDYVVNNPDGKIATPKDIVALIRKGHVFPSVERIIEKITFTQNIAIVMGKEIEHSVKTGQNENPVVTRRFTNVWVKSDGGWQLAARQSSKVLTAVP